MGVSDQSDNIRQNIQDIRRILNEQILSPVPLLKGHSKERVHILDLMSRTVNAGESNSALLIGPRGCGKTTLVKDILSDLKKDSTFSDKAIVVHLNGLIHTDDRLSLRDMTRQMQLENVVQDKVFGSFSENLTFLLECLRLGEKGTSKATLIILDEFDLFCNHKNQTLLYNLFDVSQSAQAPICIVGITSRLDVTELLEKRVRSRFSHRQILLLPENGDENSFVNVTADLLSLPKKALKCPGENKIVSSWNDAVKGVLSNIEVSSMLRQLMDISKNERVLRNFLACIASRLDEKHPMLEEGDFIRISKLFIGVDSKIQMLEGLSVLELCLVISMKHINEIYDKEPFNFEMVFNQYKKFISKQSTVQGVEKHIALGAFETLQRLEFIQPAAKGSMKIKYSSGIDKAYQKEFQLFYFLVTSDQVMDAVRNYKDLPTEVSQWASSCLV